MASDFWTHQLPILVLCLGIWAMTARAAWQRQESATPLLLQSMAQIREARARAAGAPQLAATPASAAPVAARPKTQANGLGRLIVSSIRSWVLPQPAQPAIVEGNPRARVWVDLKTGLYYCPGADYYGYGGESRGKVMSQKAAQYEYFQPATGAPCE